jgi:hypothetical protein
VFPLDDAYITLHNARVLLAGGDDPLYGASPLIGATSAVHLLLVSLVGLILPLPHAAFALSFSAALLYALGLERLVRSAGVRGWQVYAIATVGLLSSYLPIQFVNGLETSLALAAVTWALVLADDRRLPFLCGAMPFIRPELAFLAAPLFGRHLWMNRNNPRAMLMASLLALASFLPWSIWYLVETGAPFPNTAGAKVIFFGQAVLPFPKRLLFWGQAIYASLLLPLLPAALGLAWVRAGWCGALFAAVWLLVALVTLPGSLAFNDARYLAVIVPVLTYGLAGIAARQTWGRWYVLALASFTAVTFVHAASRLHDEIVVGAPVWERPADFVRDHVPPGSVVLVHDAGWVAWKNPRVKLIDVVGLKSPASAEVHRRYRARDCQWGPALSEIAAKNQATHVVVLEQLFWNCVGRNLREAGWRTTPVYREPGYFAVYRIQAPPLR